MGKTIKQLADALGVSKTAVRKYMTPEFRCEHTETDRNGVITIDPDGCKLIAETMGTKWNQPETTENNIPETPETAENLTIPKVVWDALQEQLKAKDLQIDKLNQLLDQEQQLHAKTIQRALPEPSAPSEGVQSAVELVQDEDCPEVTPERPAAQSGLQAALSSLSFGERWKLLFGRKEK